MHPRLVDLQTQVFAASAADHTTEVAARRTHDPLDSDEHTVRIAFATSIGTAELIDERSFAHAAARLDRVHEVGVTERLDALLGRLADRWGWDRDTIPQENVSPRALPVPAGLRERIERDNRWDRLLYEQALARA